MEQQWHLVIKRLHFHIPTGFLVMNSDHVVSIISWTESSSIRVRRLHLFMPEISSCFISEIERSKLIDHDKQNNKIMCKNVQSPHL